MFIIVEMVTVQDESAALSPGNTNFKKVSLKPAHMTKYKSKNVVVTIILSGFRPRASAAKQSNKLNDDSVIKETGLRVIVLKYFKVTKVVVDASWQFRT